eukprot:gene463-biopygen9086
MSLEGCSRRNRARMEAAETASILARFRPKHCYSGIELNPEVPMAFVNSQRSGDPLGEIGALTGDSVVPDEPFTVRWLLRCSL